MSPTQGLLGQEASIDIVSEARVTFFDLVCMWTFISLIHIMHKSTKFDIA